MALETPAKLRERSLNLNVGFDEQSDKWELILRYSGDLELVREKLGIEIHELLGGYAVAYADERQIAALTDFPQIDYVEKPKSLSLERLEGMNTSCVSPLRLPQYGLTGKGVLVACIDSGVDIYHPDFRNANGSTRIVALWDQTIEGRTPLEYSTGREFSQAELNVILESGQPSPTFDGSGHGTAVLGIMAGNGRASDGQNAGMAPEADILVVKMGNADSRGFPRTTQLMLAVDYAVRTAMKMEKPLVINISYGNNYGNHNGGTIVESYIDAVANLYPMSIVTGSGNEGLTARHAAGHLPQTAATTEEKIVEFVVAPYMLTFNLQFWKSYADRMDIYLETPENRRLGPFSADSRVVRYESGTDLISVYWGEPTPYNSGQELYISWVAGEDYITSGIWRLVIRPRMITDGYYNLWLPVDGSTTAQVMFLRPELNDTAVIPSTAANVITVSAYDSRNMTMGSFSGRGAVLKRGLPFFQKPDIAAPGVSVNTCSVGGGYEYFTGTSFAAPFVSGAAALLMEYGIVDGKDSYLYGEKLRAYLIKGAVPLPFQKTVPDNLAGYGRLCVENSLRR